jgi:hypothetical protein
MPSTPHIAFYNKKNFIRIENSLTSVSTYLSKTNLIFQADEETSFFLKSEGVQMFFLYEDVLTPTSNNIKALMEVFQSWTEDETFMAPLTQNLDTTVTLMEIKTFFDKEPLRIAELITGGGTSTFAASKSGVDMAITTDAASRVIRQTKAYGAINSSKVTYTVVGCVLVSDDTARNVVSRVGCFDDDDDITYSGALASGNGIFFQYESGTGLSNVSGSQVDTKIPRASWNMDTLVGLDPTDENMFVFEWSAHKGNSIRAGYMTAGIPVFCHQFSNVNFGCGSLPLRWEIGRLDAQDTSSDAATMLQSAASILAQGNYEVPMLTRSKAGDAIKSVTNATSPMPIWSLRLRPAANRGRVQPRRLHIVNLEQGVAQWSLLMNATLTGSSFSDIGNGSYAQWSEDETTVSSGIVVSSGFFSDIGTKTIELDSNAPSLRADIAGQPDTLTLVVKYLRGVVMVSSSMEWSESE